VTELLYLATIDDAYRTTFSATITALPPGGIVLDRTLFYPTGGGQPSDTGTIRVDGGAPLAVRDVSRSGSIVVHRIARAPHGSAPLRVGLPVEGTVDWERRYRHMRSHTLQHLLSARVFARTGRRTQKAQLHATGGTIDLDGAWPADPALAELRADVESYVQRDLPVRVLAVARADYDREPAERSGLVPLPSHVDPVRLVAIEAADRCPCGGTHLRATGEIGAFLLDPPLPQAGGSRLSFTLRATAPPTPPA
jgi:misacylated tRNA(Ala) deacylase